MFRVFRALRVVRVVRLAPTFALHQQIFLLGVTVFSLIFVAAGLFQSVEAEFGDFDLPFHEVCALSHNPSLPACLSDRLGYDMRSCIRSFTI